MKRVLVVVSVLAVLGVLGTGVYVRVRPTADDDSTSTSAAAAAISAAAAEGFATDVAIPVEGAAVTRDTLVLSVTAAGQAEAWRRTITTAEVAGRVMRLGVRESDAVTQGQMLVSLDTAEYALAVAKAQSALRAAEANFLERTLFDDQITDPQVREQRRRLARSLVGLDAAEVALREAELNLARTRVLAPFDGRVANLKVVEGQRVTAGQELFEVVDSDPVKVEVQVLEGEIGYLAPGRSGSVSFAAFPGESFAGRIETMNPVVDPQTRTARVTILLPNAAGRIRPGMYARVALAAQRFPDRILVPRAAILERDRRTMLFVYQGDERQGLAKWRYVTTGLGNETLVEIVQSEETEMVQPGEIVLVDGHYTLVHDAVVRLAENVLREGGRPQ
ncbi:MAG: efflux RND transporter periplasmic adaptor subunit [Gemmatimonadetes bacterium]|nr:efflux RND transporter periplasmic adaptor subunit [Gemmatimonadota bacterium]